MDNDRKAMRRELRERRNALSPDAQRTAAMQVVRLLSRHLPYRRASRCAMYIAADGELSPALLLEHAVAHGKQVFLPVLDRKQPDHMWFASYRPGQRLVKNRYGIDEPVTGTAIQAWMLDVIFLPLVGFDRAGNRLGMGGGFYDRTLAFMQKPSIRRPVLAGLAHSCQEVDSLASASWDIPLDYIVTEKQVLRCQPRKS